MTAERPRIALVAGTLGQGGAEKQLLYLAQALLEMGAEVRVLCLTRGEFFEPAFRDLGLEPVWVGRFRNPLLRAAAITRALRAFRPHVVQAGHFYVSLYVGLVAPLVGAVGIGAVRSDMTFEMRANGRWTRWHLRLPSVLIANSYAAQRNVIAQGVAAGTVHVLPNVIDLPLFDRSAAANADGDALPDPTWEEQGGAERVPVVVGVGTCTDAKRFDRFLRVLAAVRARGVPLRGMLIGDGPDRPALEALARDLGLLPHTVWFAGRRADVPRLLRHADIYLLSSDHEGFPNVLLEAMAARLPVVTTGAGDAGVIVENGVTGFAVEDADEDVMADRLAELAASPSLRERLGDAGRERVERRYAHSALPERVSRIYDAVVARPVRDTHIVI
jgi:glycosyltransferase involved in cell wall biosynthesis